MKLPFGIELKRDTNYYFGLTLLSVAVLCIVWAILKDAFEPRDFLVYFLIYSWGYVLILKSDSELRIGSLELRIKSLEKQLNPEEVEEVKEEPTENLASEEVQDGEEFQPGLYQDTNEEEPSEIFNELKGEE